MTRSLLTRAISTLGSLSLSVAFAATSLPAQSVTLPEGTIQVPGGTGTWIDAPASLPPGTRMLLLEGHPGTAGFFTTRLRLSAGARLQPHWHPADERVTIVSGLVRVGFGDRFDEKTMATFGPGSVYLNPAKSHHYVWVVEPTEMQLTGMGPWELHLLGSATREGGVTAADRIDLDTIATAVAQRSARGTTRRTGVDQWRLGRRRGHLGCFSARMCSSSGMDERANRRRESAPSAGWRDDRTHKGPKA